MNVQNEYKGKIGIILVNYNGALDTVECVDSIEKSSYKNYEIYVVDNASNDKDVSILEKLDGKVTLLKLKENVGFSGGNNRGISLAIENGCEYILLLNNDTIIEKDTLTHMIDTLQSHHEVGILGCRIHYFSDRENVWFAGGKIVKAMGTTKHYMKLQKGFEYVSFLTGCCMLISSEVIQQCGMLSEEYFLYYEDADYCEKVVRKGWKLAADLDAVIYHKVSSSTMEYSDNYFYYVIRNRFLFIKNNINGIHKAVAYVYSMISMLYKFLKYKKKSIIIGFRDFICQKKGKK
jgi:GT2 family glycosyltransferase